MEPLARHRVEIEFDDGIYARLICPETGCQPATICASCGRDVRDSEGEPCYDCPRPSDECWIQSWFDNLTADELLRGKLTVEIDAEWNDDHVIAHIVGPVEEAERAPS